MQPHIMNFQLRLIREKVPDQVEHSIYAIKTVFRGHGGSSAEILDFRRETTNVMHICI